MMTNVDVLLTILLGFLIRLCLSGLESFQIESSVSGNTQPAGATIQLVCKINNISLPIIEIYRTENKIFDPRSTTQLASCQYKCGPASFDHYQFSLSISGGLTVVTSQITGIQRSKDAMWWTCRVAQLQQMESLQLIVATNPSGVAISSNSACDLAYSECIVDCHTSSCTYPSPTFNWFYTTDNGGTENAIFRDFKPTSKQTGELCPSPEKIYWSTLTLPKYTTLLNNKAQSIRLFCRLEFPTLTSQLTSNLSTNIQMAVQVRDVTIEPATGDEVGVTENQPKTVQCRTSGSRPASTVVWFKQQEVIRVNITDGIKTDTRTSDDLIVTISTLIFQGIREDQGWNLSCSASNFGNEISATNTKTLNVFHLNVTSFTAGSYGGQQSAGSTTVDEHTDVKGVCKVNSNPSSTIKVSQSGMVIAQEDTASQLHFRMTNVTCSNNGKIICRAYTNESSLGIVEESLQLNVRCSPRLEKNVDPVILVREETTAVLSLSVLAFPPPKCFWHRRVNNEWVLVTNGSEFLITSSRSEYNLTVTSIQRQHYGEYDMTAFTCNEEDQPLRFSFFLENQGSSSMADKVNAECDSVAGATGGAVGGLIALDLIIVSVVCVLRRKRLTKDMKSKVLCKRSPKEPENVLGQQENTAQSEMAYMQLEVAGMETDRYESLELATKGNTEDKRQKHDKSYENPIDLQDDISENKDRQSMPSVPEGRQKGADQCYENIKTTNNKAI